MRGAAVAGAVKVVLGDAHLSYVLLVLRGVRVRMRHVRRPATKQSAFYANIVLYLECKCGISARRE